MDLNNLKKMETINKEQAIQDLEELFGISEKSLSKRNGNCFLIDKREYERFEVIEKLMDYFSSRSLDNGQGCKVSNITLLYTTFEIVKAK